MAKKKKRTAKRTTKRTTKKRKTTAPSKRTTPRRSTGNSSVDLLLKRFAKERLVKESELAALCKRREGIEEKVRKYREQIAKLAEREQKIQAELDQLDARRDRDVSQLLAKLGVQLGRTANQSHSRESDAHRSSGGGKSASRERVAQPLPSRRDSLN